MSMVLYLGQNLASPGVGTGSPVVANATPFAAGRNAVAKCFAMSAGTVQIQTAARNDPNFNNPATVATFTPTSPTTQEITLDYWLRYNVTAAATNTGAGSIHLEGVQ